MSEAFEAAREEGLQEEADHVEDDAPIEGAEAEGEGDGEEGEDRPAAKETDWQKRAHDKEGLAAKERSRRRAAEREIAEMRSRMEKLEAAKAGEDPLEALAAQLREDDDDPITDLATTKALIKQFLKGQREEQERSSQQSQQTRAVQQLVRTMEDHEADFAEDHSDYKDAAKHYREQRREELEEIGYSGQELQAALANDLFGVVRRALDSGRDPAEAVYNLAKKRGFASGQDATARKLAKIGEAAAAGARPSGGKGKDNPLSWGDVAKLSGAARDAAFAKLRDRERRAG